LVFGLCDKKVHIFFLQHPDGRATVVSVHTGEDIGKGLLRSIIREAKISPEEFLENI
jgi:predicted RNA binding protein YcfA (HicA-like mRNA interferase family)